MGSSPQLNTWNAPALPSTKFSRPLAAASASWGIKCWKNDSKLNSDDCSNFGKTDLSWIVRGSSHHLLLHSHYHVPAPRGIPEQLRCHPQPLLCTRNLGHTEGDNPLRFSRRAEEWSKEKWWNLRVPLRKRFWRLSWNWTGGLRSSEAAFKYPHMAI